jgi:hypothetical protein
MAGKGAQERTCGTRPHKTLDKEQAIELYSMRQDIAATEANQKRHILSK